MQTFRFKDFEVYSKAKFLYSHVLLCTKSVKDFSFRDQVRRASLSIILNIAEGSAKLSDREFAQYLQTALGSVNEVVACLDVMQENNLIQEDDFQRLSSQCEVIAKQLGGLFKKVRFV